MRLVRIGLAALAAMVLLAGAGAVEAAEQGAALGRIDFPASGSPAAMPDFLHGVLLLHSFEYADAAEAFRKAQKADPGFAMAYWGEAMTYNHPLWMQRDRAAAVKALERLAPTSAERIAKAPTEREKLYMEAVEELWAEGDKADRDRAYAEAMKRLHERFPDDLDAAAFYGLALLGTCEEHRDVRVYMQAAAIEEEVFAKNPQHPGAAHYLIHCYDDPVHAPLGMRPARVYSKIAPDAVHALHMPSHIFFASGMWDEAVASNEASWKASVDRAARKKLPAGDHSFHALSWLEYANLQLGRWRDARAQLSTMETDAKADPGEMTTSSLSTMRAIWIVETRRCEGLVPPSSATAPRDEFVRGLCALDSGDRAGAKAAMEALGAPAAAAKDESHMHGGGSSYSRSGASVGPILGLELQALLAFGGGNRDEGLRLAAEAVAAEDAMSFEFGPPVVVKPAHELEGELLLASGKPADARKEFEASLSHDPGRALSLLGLARAEAASGDAVASKETSAKLAKQWSQADPDVKNRAEVLAAAGR